MTQLTRFNRSLLNDFLGDYPSLGYLVRPLHGDALPDSFKVDIKETKDGYLFHAELPGVRKEDLHVTVEGKLLTIAAEIKQNDEQREEDKVIRSERYFGSVSRSFTLPSEVDQSVSEAKYENGILDLLLRKKSSQGSTRIEIK